METTKKYARHGDQTRTMLYLIQLQDMTIRQLSEAAEVPHGRATNFVHRFLKRGDIQHTGFVTVNNSLGGRSKAKVYGWKGKPNSEGLLLKALSMIVELRTKESRALAKEIIAHLEGISSEVK